MRSCPHCFSPYAAEVEFCGIDGTRLVVAENDPLLGKEVDRYRIVEHLGSGAMARVYRATHKVLELEYAVKVLFGEIAADKKLAERFRREAQVISKLSHPNIVTVVDFGTTQAGLTFLTMELLRGRTLRDLIKREAPLSAERTAKIVRQIASGLAEAHARGFVHRDLKPGNIMLVEEDKKERAKILDFGLVRTNDNDGEEAFLTKTGQFLGTPIYMAPEQIIGADVTHHADLYALGIVLFEMIEGKPPFRAKTLAEIRRKHLTEPPPPMRASNGLEALAQALLHKDANERPETASAVVARIDLLFDASGLGGPPEITLKTEMPFLEEDTKKLTIEAEPTVPIRPPSIVPELPVTVVVPEAIVPSEVIDEAPRLVTSLVGVDADPTEEPPPLSIARPPEQKWMFPVGVAALSISVLAAVLLLRDPPASEEPAVIPAIIPEKIEPPRETIVDKKIEAIEQKIEPKVEEKKIEAAAPAKETRSPSRVEPRKPKRETREAAPVLTLAVVQKRLDQVSELLGQASSRLKEPQLRPFEDRYLALAQTLGPSLSAAELAEIKKRADALYRDIARATEK
jgi:serine/threonine protein kinase